MSLLGRLFHMGDKCLYPFGLQLALHEKDFDDRLLSQPHIDLMLRRTSEEIELWLQHCILPVKSFPLSGLVHSFYEDYLNSRYRMPIGGGRFNSLLWLHVLSHALKPSVIVDSGTYLGASAWALSRKNASRVLSFDIQRWPLASEVPIVDYHLKDWAEHDLSSFATENGLCFFDDHVDQIRRVLEAHARGFRWLIFDDCAPFTNIPLRCKDATPLPKLDFIYDDDLQDGKEIVWARRGRQQRYKVDRAYLDKAKVVIAKMQTLPDLEPFTGARSQTPYKLVLLKSQR